MSGLWVEACQHEGDGGRGPRPGAAQSTDAGGTGAPSCAARSGSAWARWWSSSSSSTSPSRSGQPPRRGQLRSAIINLTYLALGVLLELAALATYTELTHSVLPAAAPRRFRSSASTCPPCPSATLPGWHGPGAAAGSPALDRVGRVGSAPPPSGSATQGIGSAVVLNVIFWLSLLISIPLQGYNPLYGFAAILGVLLLAIFAALVYLLTRRGRAGRRLREEGGRPAPLRASRDRDLARPEGGGSHEDPVLRARTAHQGRHLGVGQLVARRRPSGSSCWPRSPHLAHRRAGGLRPRQHLGRTSRSPRAVSGSSN